MSTKPEADRNGLILVIAETALKSDVRMSDVNWETLPADTHATLRAALNQGIDPEKVRLRLVTHGERVQYAVAAYRDNAADFTAYYIAQGSWLVASYEN